jgi:TonB-dependent starch-binding outer membrane protein SusC
MKRFLLTLCMLLAVVGIAMAQRNIVGTVTSSDDGEALVGATIRVKGTSVGTQTDINGKFSVAVPAGSTTLLVSYTGHESQEVDFGASNALNIVLKSTTQLGEIVVTGTGVGTDKRKLPIDVQTISSKGLPPAPTASIDQALVGKIAGAQISSVNGTPGADVSILLRGINTINRGTQPMIMLDGVELGASKLNTLSLFSTDRVEVVQGAAAASLYGAQGANGVIQLFTKRGQPGKLQVDFSTSYTVSNYLNIGNVRKADLHGFKTNDKNEVIGGSGNPLTYDNSVGLYSENLIWASTDPTVKIDKPYNANLKYVDHLDMFMQSAPTTNNAISFGGGSDKFDFLVGASHNTQGSNLVGNGNFARSNLFSNLGFELAKNLKFRSISQMAFTNSSINDRGGRGTIYAMFNTRPFLDYSKRMDNGEYPAFQGSAGGPNATNPFYINDVSTTSDRKIDIAQSFNLNYQPVKWLELDAKYGLNYQTFTNVYNIENQTQNPNIQETFYYWYNNVDDGIGAGEIETRTYSNNFSNLLTSATLKYGIGSMIKGSTYVAWDYRNREEKDNITYTTGLPIYRPYTPQQGASPVILRDRKTPFVTYGYVVSQHFDFGEYAGVTGGFRSDWSSAFGRGSKAFIFPRADAYFRVSELDFFKNSPIAGIIPEFKLRAAWGSAGIQPKPFDRYVTLGTRKVGDNIVFFNTPNQSNPDLEVEISTELELGTDIVFSLGKGDWFKSLAFQPSYWTRETNNAIWDVDGVPSAGISTYKSNSFGLSSKGFQIASGIQVADKRNFNWRLNTNFGRQSSKISKIQGPPVVLITAAGSTGYVLEEGTKIGQLFGFLALDNVAAKDKDGEFYIPADEQPKYEVASNGYVVNKTTKAPYFTPGQYSFGDPNPTFIINFINSMTFKNLVTFNFQVDWIQGAHLYNQTKEWMYRDGIHSDYQQPFTVNGETGAWSAFYRGAYAERSRNGTKSYFYEDASFVRLRNIEFIFQLNNIVKSNKMRKLELVLSGRNLWTKTKYTGLDPEINSSNTYQVNSAWDRGTDHNTMPNLKQYQIGLNIGF